MQNLQSTDHVLMVRPKHFGFNPETAATNAFQTDALARTQDTSKAAAEEFDRLAETLRISGVKVIIADEPDSPILPDSVFPNNWVSFHPDGSIFLYPMLSASRRLERRHDILETISRQFRVLRISDFSGAENEGKFLEGTGSLVFDHLNRLAFACRSGRTHDELLKKFQSESGYRVITFEAVDESGKAVYHTNVVMCIGSKFAAICLDSIRNQDQKTLVATELSGTGREIIELGLDQMMNFAGNMIELRRSFHSPAPMEPDKLILMSSRAWNCLRKFQQETLSRFGKVIHAPIPTIENAGGGSVRCMIAEIFLDPV